MREARVGGEREKVGGSSTKKGAQRGRGREGTNRVNGLQAGVQAVGVVQ